MKKALIPFLLSAIILSCGCETKTAQQSSPENPSVTDSTVSSTDPVDITSDTVSQTSSEEDSSESFETSSEESSSESYETSSEESEVNPAETDTLETIQLTDEQKQVITTLYEDYTKLAYVFFNQNFEVKDIPEMFKDTEYEFERVILKKEELPAELVKICEDWSEDCSYPSTFIRYTGSAVNTEEKLKSEMSKYFTDKFIENAFLVEHSNDDPMATDAYYYTWEADGASYRQCPEGGMTSPLGDKWDLYVKEYNETDDKIEIKMLYDQSSFDWGKSYYYITLEKEADGSFKLDDFYLKRIGMDGEEFTTFLVNHFYSKGTLKL